MKTILKSRQNGFAIIEALIAFLLLGIGVAALIYLQGNLMSGSSASKARAEAMELAQFRMEILRNYAEEVEFQVALYSAVQKEPGTPIQGVNAEYTVSYELNETEIVKTSPMADVQLSTSDTQHITVRVNWPNSEGDSEEVSLETMLYFIKPEISSAINAQNNGDASKVLLPSPWISGVEGEDPNPPPSTGHDPRTEILQEADPDDPDSLPISVDIKTYYNIIAGVKSYSNVEVLYEGNVVLTSFGGIVYRIKGKVITDRFSVPLDADNNGELSDVELRNYWVDDGGPDVLGIANDGVMQENEVKYWMDGSSDVTERSDGDGVVTSVEPDGIIQDDEYTYWVDDNPSDGIVQTSEFDPPEATATASSTIEDLSVLGSPPSFCIFPICDDDNDTDNDCKVPVDGSNDADSANDNVDEYGVASYVCYVPGDCTYQDDYAGIGTGTEDTSKLNGCPEGFVPPTDDDFDDLNGGWYGRIGNFGVKLNPDDMVCTADTTKTHLTPSREYVTYRGVCSDGTLTDETSCISGSGSWGIIGNEGTNTPYSNQTFIIARKNNKPSVYCPIRALSYPGNLVNEQIKRELNGIKEFVGGIPVVTVPDWDKNIVLPENECITGLSCPP